jgi:HAD superfamily hydrolase (TIGR01509 family)
MSGRRNRDNIRHIFSNGLTEAQIHEYQLEKESAYREAFRPHLAPLPGLVELLAAARSAELEVALVTSAPPVNIDFVLDGLHLRGAFDTVVGESEVRESKPDPEIYLLAASRLGAKPAECVVFEDSLAGIAAGRAAKMPVVGVTTTHSAKELHECAIVVPDFRGLTIADLTRAVA